ncbi:MAG: HU family DNA-binding protein [Clostridia bacterium]|nr:HU family DNA-binding protein [Clostridia bacterium]
MNKSELVGAVAEKAGLSKKDADKACEAFVEVMTEALAKGDKVSLVGFGTFGIKERPAREGINPFTQEKIKIAASKAPFFKAGKALKETVNK